MNWRQVRQIIWGNRALQFYIAFLVFVLILGAIGPEIAPYSIGETLYAEDGSLLRNSPPSLEHPLGTNDRAQDVLSLVLVGARPTLLTGILAGSLIITIGMTVGITAGYVGGYVDSALMRFTDFVYGVPLIPFAIVLIALMGIGHLQSILVIGLVLWRGSARVLRSQVLQVKQRPYVRAAKVSGASTPRIIRRHILPNVAPMAVLFFALGAGYAILIQAGLAFLGITSPFLPSWGVIIRNAYRSGSMTEAWWWSLPPGFLISLTVLSAFMIGREYEALTSEGELTEAYGG